MSPGIGIVWFLDGIDRTVMYAPAIYMLIWLHQLTIKPSVKCLCLEALLLENMVNSMAKLYTRSSQCMGMPNLVQTDT